MNVGVRQPMSLHAFLAWEEAQALRHEFDGVQVVAMVGGTSEHALIVRNLAIKVGGPLLGKPCRFYGSEMKIEVAGSIRYPDGFVVCTQVPRGSTVVRDPVVIFEVLSTSTSNIDYGAKNREYAATPSVRRYVILEQDKIAGTMFERIDGDWVGHILAPDAMLRMPEIGLELPMAALYIDVPFAETEVP
jgi:Uma2 family endonuclease